MTRRRGYTLIEILLVLAVLAVIAGIAWPALLRFSNERALKDAGQRLLGELDRTRFRAVEAGLMYQFRYEPGGTHFISVPAETPRPAADQTTQSIAATTESISGHLDEGLTFEGGLSPLLPGQPMGGGQLAGLADSAQLQRVQWSDPIFYFPDGTADDAAFRIVDEQGRYVAMSVRALTGMARAGPLQQETTPWE